MLEFSYKATDADHTPVEGKIEAESAAVAVTSLERKGLTVLSVELLSPILEVVEETPPVYPSAASRRTDPFAKDGQLVQRARELLDHRDEILPLLTSLAQEIPVGQKRRQIRGMADQLKRAEAPEELLNSKHFVENWLPLIAGQGSPGAAPNFVAMFNEVYETGEIRRQHVRSFVYPVCVAALALGVLIFCSVLLVPSFASVFADFGLELPGLTMLVLGISECVVEHPFQLVLSVLAIVAVVYAIYRLLGMSTIVRNVVGSLFKGRSRQLVAMAAFLRSLAEARELGLSAAPALRLAAGSNRPEWIRDEALYLAAAYEADASSASAWTTSFPDSVLSALQPETSQGASVSLLKVMAANYSERVRRRFDWTTGFAPQLAIVFVGFTVAIVAIALYLPLVELINGLTG